MMYAGLPFQFVRPPKERKPAKRSGHQPGTCPSCGLKSYKRMSERERRVHTAKHTRVREARKA